MEPTSKLRVAVPDGENALQVVTTEIEEATGIGFEPEFRKSTEVTSWSSCATPART